MKLRVIAVTGILLFGFQPDSSASLSQPTVMISQGASCNSQQRLLLRTSQGLLYPSESDYPFEYFSSGQQTSLPSSQKFLQLIGQQGQPITQVNFNQFFGHLTTIQPWMDEQQRKDALRYRLLKRTFEQTFTNLTVYRVGRTQIKIYITGINSCGMSGLKTISIET